MRAALLCLVLVLVGTVVGRTVVRSESSRHHGEGGHHGGHSNPHPTPHQPDGEHEGNYVYRACHKDFEKFCPNLHPTTAKALFEAECFKTHKAEFSEDCTKALAALKDNDESTGTSSSSGTSAGTGGTSAGSGTSAGTGGAVGTPVYEACKEDQVRVCPSLDDPWTENELFESNCFKDNVNTISPSCKALYERWILNRHFLLGIVVSGSVMVLATGALSVLTVCCCVALCVRVCMKRRCRSRKCRWTKAKTVDEEVELAPAGDKSVNYEPLQQQQAEEVPAFPQTQFYFPSQQQVLDPYTAHPIYMQPVFTVTPTQQQ